MNKHLFLVHYTKTTLILLLVFYNFSFGYSNVNRSIHLKTTYSNFPKSFLSEDTFELHRLWLNLYQGNNAVGQTLIGYVTGATQGVDSGIDALYFNDSQMALTSLINNSEYIIQGRSVPFLETDIVSLGFKTNVIGSYTIALSNFDGLFLTNQPIFLKDNVTGVVHNLKLANYSFTSEIGVFNQRFEIRYKNDVTTFQNGSWDNGVPTIDLNAVILDNFTTTFDISAKSLAIKSGSAFTVASGTTLTVENLIINEAGVNNFVIENNAILLQNNNVPYSVLGTVKRNSYDLFRQDYTLWSSPVFEPNLRNFSPATLFNRFSTYNFTTSVNGSYQQEIFTNADVINKKFVLAKGYLIRLPNNAVEYAEDAIPQQYQGIFKGILNNGTISIPLYGIVSSVSNGLNLVGNPYPSPILISTFFATNPSIETTLYFWRKQGSANPLNYNISGYATFNSMGFVSADVNVNNETPTKIQTGQGFFVRANSDSPNNLIFNNEMRTNGAATFFKTTNENVETHRFWLNLSNDTEVVGQTLIGYKVGATQNADNGIDALYFNDAPSALTSLIDNKEYIIQGRSIPFDNLDIVSLGFKTNNPGSFTISLSNFDGLFAENQGIFLKDNQTGMLHDLKSSDYTFSSLIGVFNERFEIQYNNITLPTDVPMSGSDKIMISVKDHKITINAGKMVMDKIELIDVTGKIIYTKEVVNVSNLTIENLIATNQLLIVRISTNDNIIHNQKIRF
jgi:hypothetical protein